MSRHADLMHAANYWRQFVTNFYFDTPGDTVEGFVLQLIEPDRREKDPDPGLKLQTPDGRVYIVMGRQARLKAELVQKAPAKGDTVTIVYEKDADKAAQGMNKAKEFTVTVKRAGSGSPGAVPPGEASGEVAGGRTNPGTQK